MKYTYIKGIIIIAAIFGANNLINIALKPKVVISSYKLNADKLDLKKGAIYTLATEGANPSAIKWLSSNNKIATVNKDGQIIAKKAGQAIISAKVQNEYKDIVVNVHNKLNADILIYNDTQITTAKSEEINKISISKFKLTLSSNSYTYNGKPKKPKVQVEAANNKILKKGKDYQVKYSNNKKIGTAKVVITGLNDYTGTLIGRFKIEKNQDITSNNPSENNERMDSTENDRSTNTNDNLLSTETTNSSSTLTPTTPISSSTNTDSKKQTSTNSSVKNRQSNTNSSMKKKQTSSTSGKKKATSHSTSKKSNTNNAKKDSSTSSNASSRSETSSSASNNTSDASSNASSESSNSSSNSNNSTQSSSTTDSSNQSNNNSTQSNETSKTEASNE